MGISVDFIVVLNYLKAFFYLGVTDGARADDEVEAVGRLVVGKLPLNKLLPKNIQQDGVGDGLDFAFQVRCPRK
jgi:hypothetical protein